jgi:microcystin-dependent protein
MSDPFLGEISMAGFSFAPQGWARCDGQILLISQNSALFSLFGTQYGGDGRTTFALPDLRGRSPIHRGAGTGLTSRSIGDQGGAVEVTLTESQIPPHTHTFDQSVNTGTGDQSSSVNHVRAATEQLALYRPASDANDPGSHSIAAAGSGQPHENMPPFLTINFIVALTGIFPSPS